jgi:hypothetical protein
MHLARCQHIPAQRRHKRTQQRAARVNPARYGGAVQVHAGTSTDGQPPIQWLTVGELRFQDCPAECHERLAWGQFARSPIGLQQRQERPSALRLLQLIASSRMTNCTSFKRSLPLSACGQTKRQRSSRLASRHNPSPVDHSTLMSLPCRPRKTKTCPLRVSSSRAASTFVARALNPAHVGHASGNSDARVCQQVHHERGLCRTARSVAIWTRSSSRTTSPGKVISIVPAAAVVAGFAAGSVSVACCRT